LFAELWTFPHELQSFPNLRPEHFANPRLRRLFRSIRALESRGDPIEYHALKRELERADQWDTDNSAFLFDLPSTVATSAHIEIHVEQVIEDYRRRELQGLLQQAADDLLIPGSSPDEMRKRVELDLAELEADAASMERREPDSVGAILDMGIEEVASLVGDGVVPAEATIMLFGKPGLAKSWLLVQFAVCRAVGTAWLGQSTKQGNTLILTFEAGVQNLKRRLLSVVEFYAFGAEELQRVRESVHFLSKKQLAEFDVENDWRTIGKKAVALGCDVICIDPFAEAIFPLDENKAMDMTRVTRVLTGLHSLGLTVFLVGHPRKSSQEKSSDDDQDALRGSARLRDHCSTIMRLKEARGQRVIVFSKLRERDDNLGPIWIEQVPGGEPGAGCVRVTDAPPDPAEQSANNRKKVADAIQAASLKGASVAELVEATGLGKSTVTEHALVGQGKVTKRDRVHKTATPMRFFWNDHG
jgi:hypothetical protein